MITLNISDLLPIFSFDMWRRLDRYYHHHLKEEKSRVVERPILGLELRLDILDEALLTLPCCLLALSLRKSLENVWWDQKNLRLVGPQWQAQQPALPDLSWSDGWLSWMSKVWRGNRHHFPKANLKKAWSQWHRYYLCKAKKVRTYIRQMNEAREHERHQK